MRSTKQMTRHLFLAMAAAWVVIVVPVGADDPGHALRFDGVSDLVRLAETVYMMGGTGSGWETNKSVSLWVKPTGSATCTVDAPTHCDAVFGDRPRTWGISRGTVGGLDRLWVWNYDGRPQAIGIEYTPGEWVHVALTHGGGVLSAYKNGTLVGSVASGATVQPGSGATATLYVGGVINNTNRNWTFEGEIDEVRIFNVARSEQEIRDDMNRHLTGLEPGLAAYYQMSDGSGTTLTDDSGYGWTGTLLDGMSGVPADGPIDWVPSGAFGDDGDPNAVPVPESQPVTTPEDTDAIITLVGTDDDEDPLTFTVVTPPVNGTLTGTAPNLTYVPAAEFNGADSFTFVVEDGFDTSAEATVDIDVTPVNDVPVAVDTLVAVEQSSPGVAIDLAALVGDVETAAPDLTYTIVTGPASGSLSGSGATLTYTPTGGFIGLDTFTYQVTDRGDPDACAPRPGLCRRREQRGPDRDAGRHRGQHAAGGAWADGHHGGGHGDRHHLEWVGRRRRPADLRGGHAPRAGHADGHGARSDLHPGAGLPRRRHLQLPRR